MVIAEKLPPFDAEAEESVLASLMVDDDAVARVEPLVSPEDFYREQNRWTYEACLALWERNEAINQVTVAHELARMGRLEDAGGPGFLSRIVADLPTPVGVEHYAGIVRRDATYRRLISVAAQITRMSYEGGPDLDGTLSMAEDMILSIRSSARIGEVRHIRDVLSEYFEHPGVEAIGAGPEAGIRTGFADLDKLLGGLKRGDLIIVAARPSLGKTSLVLNFARNAAMGQNARVVFFSLEMAAEQLVQRLLSAESGVDSTRVRLGQQGEAEERRLLRAMGDLSELEIYFDDSAALTMGQIHAKTKRLRREKGDLDLVVVDYLQLIHGARTDNRVQEVGYISRGLKELAREMDVPVVACSQLSRAPEQRSPHTPMLSDLRESGSIEQDADVVMFIYREDVYVRKEDWESQNPDKSGRQFPGGIAQIMVAKHRNGPTGNVHLRFRNNLARFEDLQILDEEGEGW